MDLKVRDEAESLTLFTPESSSDLEHSFTSMTSSSSTSARSSLSLPSFSFAPSITPHPHSQSTSSPQWSSLHAAALLSPDSKLHLSNLTLLRHLGSGNLARVFHCRLRGFSPHHAPHADFALKVIDLDALARATTPHHDPLAHVRAESHVLAHLDHPFLPTLYARLDASHYACFLIDYCPNGDLHTLLARRRQRRLPLPAARFYAAEVLLALEYLHAHGFVYRDLKPENVLLRADGHVMLSDFDLCFQAPVSPTLLRKTTHHASCLGGPRVEHDVQFVAEPVAAYSRECVGTHEYLAPEMVSGCGHGNGVDWWAFGVFVYELIYGRTPFKGASKEATLRNIAAGKEVRFPGGGVAGEEAAARDLVRRLLVRDPERRLGAKAGAADIKRHPFFDGIKWPLIRNMRPPAMGDEKEKGKKSIIGKMAMQLGWGSSKKRTGGKKVKG